MKLAKRTLALVLAVMMLAAVMVVPASAASGYESRFRAIPHRKRCQIPPSVI